MIIIIISAIVIMFVAWVVFAEFVLEHYRHRHEHNKLVQALIYIAGFIFIALIDVPFNVVIGTMYFRQKPGPSTGGWTLSERLRWILKTKEVESWEWQHAFFICRKFVSPWDYNHCGMGLG